MELYLYYNCLIYVNSLRKEIVKHMQKILPKELADEIMQNKTAMYRVAYSITNNDADAQDAVGAASRTSRHTLCHLALYHACATGDKVAVLQHAEEYLT